MQIKFKKKKLYTNLFLGAFWTVLGIFNLQDDSNLRWTDYIYLIVGIIYIAHFLWDLKNQYLIVENGTIKKNMLYGYGKRLNLNEITCIQNDAGDYIVKTESHKLKIRVELIEEKSLSELKTILDKLSLPPGKTPFANTV